MDVDSTHSTAVAVAVPSGSSTVNRRRKAPVLVVYGPTWAAGPAVAASVALGPSTQPEKGQEECGGGGGERLWRHLASRVDHNGLKVEERGGRGHE